MVNVYKRIETVEKDIAGVDNIGRLKIDNTVVMDFRIEKEENVYLMVPAGEAINRMIGGMA